MKSFSRCIEVWRLRDARPVTTFLRGAQLHEFMKVSHLPVDDDRRGTIDYFANGDDLIFVHGSSNAEYAI
ncbi:hypothetical protein [Burkholderia ubonensis]|nr:hypothetical protein [Burkholderia ubonensis]KUZ16262.1 hypothetical protein WI29_06645 [Burkholderia ubonensis]KUZ44658.1 hypothetical protein WI33_02115 [Burkholderia ubonensis]KUZ56251.1 hypothetical protein WI34_21255 [Burkholderia ubonensis]